jgi:hypothetical protein
LKRSRAGSDEIKAAKSPIQKLFFGVSEISKRALSTLSGKRSHHPVNRAG